MSASSTASTPATSFTAEQLAELLTLLPVTDSVELKATVPGVDRSRVMDRLGMDPLQAELRQVAFFDTPDLHLNSHGVVARARRIQRRPGDVVVKLRPVDPAHLDDDVRGARGFGVEIDAMPGRFVCSASMKAPADDTQVHRVLRRDRPIRKLFTRAQRALVDRYTPGGVDWDALRVLGPVTTLKLTFSPDGYDRPMVAELWSYPDGSQILELSTKCAPIEAFNVATETRAFLAGHGVDMGAPQQTKTRTALEYFASLED
ncbi:adenylate cyclase [Demequina iriomotensis]|uniref:adenylate cyclase n=1 Tax=Demequina iriomotensis TaxID=1536641 RepID=UPI000A9A8AE9|nr:adenylate cyclase [Demequina iriomotensis]